MKQETHKVHDWVQLKAMGVVDALPTDLTTRPADAKEIEGNFNGLNFFLDLNASGSGKVYLYGWTKNGNDGVLLNEGGTTVSATGQAGTNLYRSALKYIDCGAITHIKAYLTDLSGATQGRVKGAPI